MHYAEALMIIEELRLLVDLPGFLLAELLPDPLLALQQHKQRLGESSPCPDAGAEAVDGGVLLRFFDRM